MPRKDQLNSILPYNTASKENKERYELGSYSNLAETV